MKGETYEEFIEKFKPKKTTDDCYTPPEIYDIVLKYATEKYGLCGREVVRPFYPGGDYENFNYPENCVVVDNPPFSIITKIVRFYMKRGIDFFLFAPTLTLFSVAAGEANYIVCGCTVTYENGALVNTSFVTNLGEYKIETSPELWDAIQECQKKNDRTRQKIDYPENLLTAARMIKDVRAGECIKVKNAEFTRKCGDIKIYGGGMVING